MATSVTNAAEGLLYRAVALALRQRQRLSWAAQAFTTKTRTDTKKLGRGSVWLAPVNDRIGTQPGMGTETTAYPVAGNIDFLTEFQVPVRRIGGVIAIGDILQFSGDELVDQVKLHADDIAEAHELQKLIYTLGNGTGTLFHTSTAGAGTSKDGTAFATAGSYYGRTRFLRPFIGREFDFGTTADYDASTASSVTLTSITDDDTAVFDSFTSSANDICTFTDVGGTVPDGIDIWVGTGTVASVNRASAGNENLQAQVIDMNSAPITLERFDTIIDQCNEWAPNGTGVDLILCDSARGTAVRQLLRGYHMSVEPITDMRFGGGRQGHRIEAGDGSAMLISDRLMGQGTIFFLNSKTWEWIQLGPPGFQQVSAIETSGRPSFFPERNDYDAHELRHRYYANLWSFKASANGRLDEVPGVTA